MSLRALRRTAAVTALAGGLVAGLVTPANAATTTSATTTTVTYTQWQTDVTAVTAPALAYIQERIAEAASTSKLAVVLDIDNTALASYFYSSYPTPADPPVLALAQYAASKGVKIFFITARPDVIDLITEYNLKSVGYQVDGLYSRNPIQLFEAVNTFKTAEREQLESEGYDIIANIGNNTVDIEGGYADSTWELPNYDGLLD
ncbi:HAD family acid phosphatase [Actinospica sp.]|uniref:HAD family acid phosphatase n=1 Tax=Actinospica sp. TaxID=1872142 RepID=UPI002BD9A2DB|nr:HAD family acid phosphatase [Actinospica sp.]HWG22945.1 HAD family acid phosphatase [Actinospica sp.]